MRHLVTALAACAALTAAVPSQAAVITFDEFGDVGLVGPVIDNDYSGLGVTFSSSAGNNNIVTTQPAYNGTQPNFLCTEAGGQINCSAETILEFASPVNDLTFVGLGINDVSADVAHVDIFQGGLFTFTYIVAGNGEGFDPVLVDLSGFIDITKIRIHSITDGGGIGWDTFAFETGEVPEPATLSLLGLGLAGLVARRSRRS